MVQYGSIFMYRVVYETVAVKKKKMSSFHFFLFITGGRKVRLNLHNDSVFTNTVGPPSATAPGSIRFLYVLTFG